MFSKEFNSTALNLIIENEDFANNVNLIKESLFEEDEYSLEWFKNIKKFINKYGYINKKVFYEEYEKALILYEKNDVSLEDYVKINLKKFIFVSNLIQFVKDTSFDLTDCKFGNIDEYKLLKELDVVRSCWLEDKGTGEIDYLKDSEERIIQLKNIIGVPTGLNQLDELLMGKGLCNGELGVILAMPNSGKSGLLINIAYNAFMYGRKVLYVTLEMDKERIALRMDMRINGMNTDNVLDNPDKIFEKLEDLKKDRKGEFYIKGFQSCSTTVKDLKKYILSKRIKGIDIDFLIVDYADLLVDSYSNNKSDDYTKNINVYRDLRGLGNELNLPIWTASQSNRKGYDQENLDMNNFADSFGKGFIIDVGIAIQPPSQAKLEGKEMTLHLIKNRNGETKKKIDLYCDWKKMLVDNDRGRMEVYK